MGAAKVTKGDPQTLQTDRPNGNPSPPPNSYYSLCPNHINWRHLESSVRYPLPRHYLSPQPH